MTFDAVGNLYVTDVGPEPPAGAGLRPSRQALIRTIGTTAGLNFPNGVAVDAAGNVYVTDSNNGRLVVFDADGHA